MPTSGWPLRSIEDVDPTGLARLGDRFAFDSAVVEVEQHDRRGRVVVPDVVMHLLVMPAVLSGLRVERDDRRREQVVALADRAVVVGPRIARAEVEEAELGIDGRRIPNRRAAVLPDLVVLRPRVVADLARARDRVERPDELAVLRAERFHAAAHAFLAAREARDDEPVVVERRRRDRVALLPAFRLDRPDDLAAALIERDELAVELAREHLAVAEPDAAARPAAADRLVRGVEVRAVFPEDLARRDAHREHVVRARRDVGDAAIDERLRLARVLRSRVRSRAGACARRP